MISWLQRSFQRHFKLMFLLLLAAVIVPFVFTIGNMPGCGSPDAQRIKAVEFFGREYRSAADWGEIQRKAQISLMLSYGYPDPNRIGLHAERRAAGLYLADKLGIPEPNRQQLESFIQTLGIFAGPDGAFNPQSYAQFVDNLRLSPGMSEADVSRVLAEDWRIAEVTDGLRGPGYVLDYEIRQQLEQSDTKWTVETATLDLANVQPATEPTEEDLRRWFEANSFRYETPERVRVQYAEFRAADFASRVQLTEEEISAFFEQNKARYQPAPPPPPADGSAPPPPAPEPTLEEVRDRVVADLTQQRAARLAARAASDFEVERFRNNIEPATAAFDSVLAKHGGTLKSVPPFTQTLPPAGTNWPPQILSAAFRLDQSQPASTELRVGDDTIILFLQERIPPTPAEFLAVRDRVLEDVRADLRRRAITAKGEEIRAQIAAAMKTGQTFSEAAKAAGLEPKTWESFTRTTPPPDFDNALLGSIPELASGEVSPMSVQGERGAFVVVVGKELPDTTPGSEAYERVRRDVMTAYSQYAGESLLAEIVQDERTASGLEQPAPAP